MHWKGIYLRRLTKQTEIKADSLKSSLQNASMNFTNMTSHMRETKNGVVVFISRNRRKKIITKCNLFEFNNHHIILIWMKFPGLQYDDVPA